MKTLLAFSLCLFAIISNAANPSTKSFRASGGLTVTSNDVTGLITYDGSGISSPTGGVTAATATNIAEYFSTNTTGRPAPPLSSVQFNSNGVMQGSESLMFSNHALSIGQALQGGTLNLFGTSTHDTLAGSTKPVAVTKYNTAYDLTLSQVITAGNVAWEFSQQNNGTAYSSVLNLSTGIVSVGTTDLSSRTGFPTRLQGAPLQAVYRAWGDSITVGGLITTPYPQGVGATRGWTAQNNSVSLHMVADDGALIYSNVPNSNEVYSICYGANDELQYTTNTALHTYFGAGAGAMAAWLSGPRIPASNTTAITYTGAWTTETTKHSSVGRKTSGVGAIATVFITGRVVYVGYPVMDGGDGQFNVTIDGVDKGNFNNYEAYPIVTRIGGTYGPKMARFPGLSDNAHGVTITRIAGTCYIDWIGGAKSESSVYVLSVPRQSQTGYNSNGGSDVIVAQLNAKLRAIVADLSGDGLPVSFVDLGQYMDNVDGSDIIFGDPSNGYGIHPTQQGTDKIKRALLDSMSPFTTAKERQAALNLGYFSESVTVYGNNVGIHNMTPSYPLDVVGNVRLIGNIYYSNPFNIIAVDGSGYGLSSDTTYGLGLFANAAASPRLSVATNGNIGVSTRAPSSSLDVTGQVRAASAIITNSVSVRTSDGTPRAHTAVIPGAPTFGGEWFGNITPSALNWSVGGDGASTYLNTPSGGEMYFSQDGNTLAWMNTAGDLTLFSGQFQLGGTNAGFPALGRTNGNFIVTGGNGALDGSSTNKVIVPGGLVAGLTTITNANGLAVLGNATLLSNVFLPNLRTNGSPVALLGVDAAGAVFESAVGSAGGFSVSGNSNQIPFLNVAGTGFLFGSHDKSAPGFGMVNRANGNIGALLIHVNENEDVGLVQIGPPNAGSSIATFVPSLSVSNRYDGGLTQEMVRVNYVDVGGTDAESMLQTWRNWDSAGVNLVSYSGLRKDGRLSLAGGLRLQGGATLTNVLYATTNINFPSTAAGTVSDAAVSVPGAADGEIVSLGIPSNAMSNGVYCAWASNDVCYIRFANNNLVSAVDPGAGVFRVRVDRFAP